MPSFPMKPFSLHRRAPQSNGENLLHPGGFGTFVSSVGGKDPRSAPPDSLPLAPDPTSRARCRFPPPPSHAGVFPPPSYPPHGHAPCTPLRSCPPSLSAPCPICHCRRPCCLWFRGPLGVGFVETERWLVSTFHMGAEQWEDFFKSPQRPMPTLRSITLGARKWRHGNRMACAIHQSTERYSPGEKHPLGRISRISRKKSKRRESNSNTSRKTQPRGEPAETSHPLRYPVKSLAHALRHYHTLRRASRMQTPHGFPGKSADTRHTRSNVSSRTSAPRARTMTTTNAQR